jgi:catechol 2,3-dioxygenase-like lactoylglutathione lyase family enzyme
MPGTRVTSLPCACCGGDFPAEEVVGLRCRDDVHVCRTCAGWLHARAGGLVVTPTLPVRDMAEAVGFYEAAGFDVRLYEGGGFAFVQYGGDSVFDLDLVEHLEPTANAAGCYIIAADVDGWGRRLGALGYPVSAVEDQPWGMRELTLHDPSGNHLRFGTPSSTPE